MENGADAMYQRNKDTNNSLPQRLVADAQRVAGPAFAPRGTEPRNPNYSPPIFAGSRSEEQLRLDRERALQIKRAETRLAFVMAMAHGAVELSLKQQKPSVRRPVLNDLKNRYGLKTNMRV